MLRYAVSILFVLLIISAFTGCKSGSGSATAPASSTEIRQAFGSGKKTVVFFMNPEGGPCRTQNEILQRLHQDKGGSFNIAYVSTLRPEDQKAFYDYGVKNLPSVVIVDSSGKIANYLPPGIQTYETLARSLDAAK